MKILLPIALLVLSACVSTTEEQLEEIPDTTETTEVEQKRAKTEFEKTVDALPYLQHPYLYACDGLQETEELYGLAAKMYDYLPENCEFLGLLSRTSTHALVLVTNVGDYAGPSILRFKMEDGKMDEQHKFLQDNCPGTLTSTAYLYFEEPGSFCTFNSSAVLEFHEVDMDKLESILVVENRKNYTWSADMKIETVD